MSGKPSLPPGAEEHFTMLEHKYGLPDGYLRGMAWVETQFGTQHDRPGSQYKGMFQMGQHERQTYGVKNPADWRQSAEGAAKMGAENQKALTPALGRQPTAQELYITHQQGLGGGKSLLTHPNSPAGRVADPKFIRSNNGNPKAPASEFVQKFADRFNSAPGRNGEQAPTQFAKNEQQPQTQIAKNDFGRNIPASNQQTPGLGKQLEQAQPQTQIAKNDFGRNIPASNQQTPSVGRQLESLPQQTQIAKNDFGRNIPSNGMQTPGVGRQLESLPQQTQIAKTDFGRNIPASNQQSSGHPGLDEFRQLYALEQKGSAAPGQTQMAFLGRNDFGRNIPSSNQQTPGIGQRLDSLPQQTQIASRDFGRNIPQSNQQTPGIGQRLDPVQQQPTQLAQNQPPPGSVLNRINPRDPSGPLLPESGARTQVAQNEPSAKAYFEQRYAPTAQQPQTAQAPQAQQQDPMQARLDNQWANRPQYDYGSQNSRPSSQMSDDQILAMLDSMKGKAPEASQRLFGALDGAKNGGMGNIDPSLMQNTQPYNLNSSSSSQLADNRGGAAPLLGDNSPPASAAVAPTTQPSAPPMSFGGQPVQTAQVHQQAPQEMQLFEPQGGGGGVEGMAGGVQQAQLTPEAFDPNLANGMSPQMFDPFSDLGGLFADSFQPADMGQTQFADAGGFGGDFGGGFDFGGGLASLFG